MADATYSQIALREVEERFSELWVITYHKFVDVWIELTSIQDSITQISQQLVQPMHKNTGLQRDMYHAPMRFTKMDMPKFTREDIVGWISKCKSYFNLDKTPEEHKVTMASLTLDKKRYLWYDGFRKSTQNTLSWSTFAEGIKICFSATLQCPLEELVQLKQIGILNDYQEQFEKISSRVDLSKT